MTTSIARKIAARWAEHVGPDGKVGHQQINPELLAQVELSAARYYWPRRAEQAEQAAAAWQERAIEAEANFCRAVDSLNTFDERLTHLERLILDIAAGQRDADDPAVLVVPERVAARLAAEAERLKGVR